MQSISAVVPGNAFHDSIVHETTCISSSRRTGKEDESYITKHGDQQGKKSSTGYTARWILQITGNIGTRLNAGD